MYLCRVTDRKGPLPRQELYPADQINCGVLGKADSLRDENHQKQKRLQVRLEPATQAQGPCLELHQVR